MNVAGIVVEYNPFHNGHLLHVEQTKQQTGADVIVAVMSGNFLQRGEPAVVSKWTRTEMALLQGVDIVIELPYVYATQHADFFASGAISILDKIGCDTVCFGSESGDISTFHQLTAFLRSHKSEYNLYIQKYMQAGNSYPKASALAFKELKGSEVILDLSLPNNILGYHYVKSIEDISSCIKPYTIKRKQAQFHDTEVTTNSIASATSIRQFLLNKNEPPENISHVIPTSTLKLLQNYISSYGGFQGWDRLFPYLKYKVLTTRSSQLADIYECEEGLENRLYTTIKTANNFEEFMTKLKTKRYTRTRLQRLCLHTLTNTTKAEVTAALNSNIYLRVLGMSQTGRRYLNSRKKDIDVPIVTTFSQHKDQKLEIELRAAYCYALGHEPDVTQKLMIEEFAHPPVILPN